MSIELFDYGKESILEFIQTKIKNNNNVKTDILDKIRYVTNAESDLSSQGFYYERLWDLCIKFGVVTYMTLPTKNKLLQTSHIINENPNKISIKFKQNCWENNALNTYLQQPVRSVSSSGYSDITFINNDNEMETVYFISVKYFKQEKDIGKYDIGKLCALVKKHEQKGRTIKLCIFVKNKKKAISKFRSQNSSSNILLKYINPDGKYEHVYDITDLQNAFFKLKNY